MDESDSTRATFAAELAGEIRQAIIAAALAATILPAELGDWWIRQFFYRHADRGASLWWWEGLRSERARPGEHVR